MLAWDGMVYPVLQIGPPQDPIADMERLLEEDMKEIAKFEADRSVALLRAGLSPRREDLEYRRSSFSGISRSWDLEHFSALHPVMLALAGEFRLAQRAWEQFWRYSSGARTFSRVVSSPPPPQPSPERIHGHTYTRCHVTLYSP